MKVGDLVRVVGLRVGPGHMYNHPEIGIVTDVLLRDRVVDVLFGTVLRQINSKYIEVIKCS